MTSPYMVASATQEAGHHWSPWFQLFFVVASAGFELEDFGFGLPILMLKN